MTACLRLEVPNLPFTRQLALERLSCILPYVLAGQKAEEDWLVDQRVVT